MTDQPVTRREFVCDATAMTAAGVARGGRPRTIVAAGAPDVPPEVKKTRSYNPNMEYRRLGKTGLWVSAVCLGGHWKRVDKVIGARGAIDPYRGPQADGDMGPFLKNRQEVVSRCIEVGINCIDFAGDAEPETYCRVLEGRRDEMYLCLFASRQRTARAGEPHGQEAGRVVRGRPAALQAGIRRRLAADGPGTRRPAQRRPTWTR